MSSSNEEVSLALSIRDIVVLRLEVNAMLAFELKQAMNVKVGHNLSADPETSSIQVKLLLQIAPTMTGARAEELAEQTVGILELMIRYDVESLEKLPTRDDGIIVPADLSAALIYDAYATARGVWFSKTMGTPLQSMILPFVQQEDFAPQKWQG